MIGPIVRIQKEIARLSNQTPQTYEYRPAHDVLAEMAEFVNKLSPFEIADAPGGKLYTVVRNKKTLNVIYPS